MSDPRPEELNLAGQLLSNGKLEDALEIITNFEKKSEITPKEQLWVFLLRGHVYQAKFQLKKVIEMGEQAYQLSKEIKMIPESVEALLLKSYISILGDPDEAFDLITKAEALLDSLTEETFINLAGFNLSILTAKSGSYLYKGDFNTALESALKIVTLAETDEINLWSGHLLILLGLIYLSKGEEKAALEYATNILNFMEKLGVRVGVAHSLYVIGHVYFMKGDLNEALIFCEKSLSIKEISDITKCNTLSILGAIYRSKGELDRALKYFTQANELVDESLHYVFL